MPPHLHPRSRSTSSLFGFTLLASFIVVGVPHIFPCPAPRRTLADTQIVITEDGRQVQRVRRRRVKSESSPEKLASIKSTVSATPRKENEEVAAFMQMEEEAERFANLGRECPVPKPGGRIGALFGFIPSNKKLRDYEETPRPDGLDRRNEG